MRKATERKLIFVSQMPAIKSLHWGPVSVIALIMNVSLTRCLIVITRHEIPNRLESPHSSLSYLHVAIDHQIWSFSHHVQHDV